MAETPSVCEHLHYPLQSGSDRVLAVMHRGYTAARYLERLADARRVVPDLAVSTDIIVGFPGETDDDFERTLEVVAAAEFDYAYTFIFSPRPGTEGATMTDAFVDPVVAGERFARLRVVVERSALAKHEARLGRVEEVLVEGPSKKDPTCHVGPHPPEQARPLPSRRAVAHGQLRDGRDHPRRATPPARHVRRHRGRAESQAADPGRRAVTSGPGPRASRWSAPTASGKSAVAMAAARRMRRRRDRLGRRDAGLPGDGHRHRQADARRAGRGPSPPDRPRRSGRRVHGRRVPRSPHAMRSATSPRRGQRALLVAGTGLYHRVVIDDIDLPGQWPDVRAELDAGRRTPRTSRPPCPARRARSGCRGADGADEHPARRARARGVHRQRSPVQLVRAGTRRLPAEPRRPARPALATRRSSLGGSSGECRR